jgi:hypothetical protein
MTASLGHFFSPGRKTLASGERATVFPSPVRTYLTHTYTYIHNMIVFFEKLIVVQLVKILPAFYGT